MQSIQGQVCQIGCTIVVSFKYAVTGIELRTSQSHVVCLSYLTRAVTVKLTRTTKNRPNCIEKRSVESTPSLNAVKHLGFVNNEVGPVTLLLRAVSYRARL